MAGSRAPRSIVILSLLAALFLAAGLRAEQPAASGRRGRPQFPAPHNLQVLPKDLAPQQIAQVMQNVSSALGVQCGYCHVAAPAPPGSAGRGALPFDFASDDKPQKRSAREMMRLLDEVNPKVAAAVGKSTESATRVGCVTCHRGVAIPRPLADILDNTVGQQGVQAAITQYRDLRGQYYGAQAYDFSEGSLVSYAQRAFQASKADEAIAWLRLNLEYYPTSARTYTGLAQAQRAANDTAGAIKSLEKAVELDPQNAQIKQQLEQLKGQ